MCAKYYELRCMFYKKNCTRQSWPFAWYGVKIRVIFGVRFQRQKVDKKANLHENWNMQTILEYFEYFCQISSKLFLYPVKTATCISGTCMWTVAGPALAYTDFRLADFLSCPLVILWQTDQSILLLMFLFSPANLWGHLVDHHQTLTHSVLI